MIKEKEIYNLIINEVRQPSYYLPRNYQTVGGMWTVDTYQYEDIKLQILDEGWSTRLISTDVVAMDRAGHFEIEKGSIEDFENLFNKFSN